MKRIKFDSYSDVTAESTTNPLTVLLKGSPKSLNSIKKKLTIKNKSVRWNVERLVTLIQILSGKAKFFQTDDPEHQQYQTQINKIKKDIKVLQDSEITELYESVELGLEVPAGFWFFAGTTDGCNVNSQLQEYYAPGLRHYQQELLTQMFKYKRASGCLATGLGKSWIIASICKAAENSGLRACVVVPTDYLVGQMVETISKLTDSVSGLGGKRRLKLGTNVVVTTAQSAMKVIDNFDVIIVDEAHHSPASTWLNIFSNSNAPYVYSLTATPFRSDGLDMAIHAFTGPIVYERDARWGIANGWLKPAKVYLKTVDYIVDGKTKFLGDKLNAQKAYKILSTAPEVMLEIKNQMEKMLASGRKVIVLFKTVNSCNVLKRFCKGSIDFEVASSKWKKPIDDFRDGKSQVLVSNDRLISEGIDIPDANALIMMTQNSSANITFQAMGRVLRKTEGYALVVDITCNGFQKFLNAQEARANVYMMVTDDVFNIGVKK